jgi:tetratricopeptide (TPR) repeat protein
MSWWTADGDAARQHVQRAMELSAGLPTSVGKARAWAQAARLEGIGGDPARAIELADETLAMAEELGCDDLQSSAFNSRGIAKSDVGDPSAIDDLERSVELADRSNVPHEIATSRNNLASVLFSFVRVAESARNFAASRDAALRFGSIGSAQWAQMAILTHRVSVGGFAELLAQAAELQKEVGQGTQLTSASTFCRGRVEAVLGDPDEAVRILEQSIVGARQVGERQAIAPNLTAMALALVLAGRGAEADEALDEILSSPRFAHPSNATTELALLLVERGRGDAWADSVADVSPDNPWRRAGEAAAAGDLPGAAEIYREMGAYMLEAWARLLAAERGDLSQLEPARAYFAAEQAAPFLRRCDAVLAASA